MRRCPALPLLLGLLAESGPAPPAGCGGEAHWAAAREAMWQCVGGAAAGTAPCEGLAGELQALESSMSSCPPGQLTAAAIVAAHGEEEERRAASDFRLPLGQGASLAQLAASGFPVFGALEWLAREVAPSVDAAASPCVDQHSREFHAALAHHLEASAAVPAAQALEYLRAAPAARPCPLGEAAGVLSLALAAAGGAPEDLEQLLDRAEGLLLATGATLLQGHEWFVWSLLHRIGIALEQREGPPEEVPGGCIIMIYAWPTEEIRNDTAEAVRLLEKFFFSPLGVSYPLVVFTDPETALRLDADLGHLTSAKVVPAVIPVEELSRQMSSYSCVDGIDCTAGRTMNSSAHRLSVNSTQFWSPDYLRISRYTAGPLFLHPALDSCGAFLKIDADLFLTAPMERDPIAEMQEEGARLAYWQIHVQGQRQRGYMDAAMAYLEERALPIKNRAFYARGRFEERAASLGIPASEVPEAMEAATVVYGCLFGGDVRLFREPLYRDFFAFMDRRRGFEENGWSNQFFLGTTAAAFLYASQVKRLYISGRHQESSISVADGNVTEFLLGSSKGVFR